MFSLAALVPSPPILVPELCGHLSADGPDPVDARAVLRAATLAAVAQLSETACRWTVVGAGAVDRTYGPDTVGTFRGFGADVWVALSEPVLSRTESRRSGARSGIEVGRSGAASARLGAESAGSRVDSTERRVDSAELQADSPMLGADSAELSLDSGERRAHSAQQCMDPAHMRSGRGHLGRDWVSRLAVDGVYTTVAANPHVPLPVLIAGWLRSAAAPGVVAEAHIVAADALSEDCAGLGAKLRTALDCSAEPQGVLVVADGAATLSTAAPGCLDPRAAAVQSDLDRALTAGDRAGLLALDPALSAELAVSGRAAYQVLAGMFAIDPVDPAVETRYQDAPFGVGYHVSLWYPAGRGGGFPAVGAEGLAA